MGKDAYILTGAVSVYATAKNDPKKAINRAYAVLVEELGDSPAAVTITAAFEEDRDGNGFYYAIASGEA